MGWCLSLCQAFLTHSYGLGPGLGILTSSFIEQRKEEGGGRGELCLLREKQRPKKVFDKLSGFWFLFFFFAFSSYL